MQTTLDDEPVYGQGTQATVYTPKARLTIQKLNYQSGSFNSSRLNWVPGYGWTETDAEDIDIINEPLLSQAVSEAGTGSGYFNAEINVKGKIMYGYLWDVGDMNQGEGHYRMTFSFDDGTPGIGTAKFDESTQIIVAEEESTEEGKATEAPGSGGVPILDWANNITYMDVLIGDPLGPLSAHSSVFETFSIYPNPSKNGIVNIKNTTGTLINIYNMLGQKVFTSKVNSSFSVQTLNLSTLQSGLYLVQISDGTNTSVKKLILN